MLVQRSVLGAKCHAAINGKYSPDIEDVQAIAKYVLRHRIVRNYKAEAEGVTTDKVIDRLLTELDPNESPALADGKLPGVINQ